MGLESKLLRRHAWNRIFFEKAVEPLHVNLMALAVWLFGSFRAKVTFDLVIREYHAYSLLRAADEAIKAGVSEFTAVEFGVAAGSGLANIALIARKVTATTGVRIKVVGFDSGNGMPPAVDYRDHPDLYQQGDFPMDYERLRAALPPEVDLVIGDLKGTLGKWLENKTADSPIGYVSVDVDYYSSTVEALKIFTGPATTYLPNVVVYFDDIMFDEHNDACGELLAIKEFNAQQKTRRLQRPAFISSRRIYKNAPWLKHMFFCHILDHPHRAIGRPRNSGPVQILENPYLR